jgi:hypothetical protein
MMIVINEEVFSLAQRPYSVCLDIKESFFFSLSLERFGAATK